MDYHYILPLVALLGLFAGIIIKKFTREEVKQYRKSLVFVQKIIIIVLSLFLLSSTKNYYYLFFGAVGGFLLFNLINEMLFLGLSVSLSLFLTKQYSLLVSSAVFIYNLIFGSLLRKHRIKVLNILLFSFLFLLPSVLLIFDEIFFIDLLTGFVVGALVKYLIHKSQICY